MNHSNIIDGKAAAAALNTQTAAAAARLLQHGVTPCLAIVLVGDDEASKIYVSNKQKAAAEAGLISRLHHVPASIPQAELTAQVRALAADSTVHGIIVQMPLPASISADVVLDAVPPEKDIDGLTTLNLGRLYTGQPCFVPCTPQGCMLLIKSVRQNLSGLQAVVVGRSRLVGKPLAELLVQENCTVTVVHSKTPNPATITRQADIVCVAAGHAGLVGADWVKPGAIVIDVGINRQNGSIVGDVDFAAVAATAGAITPVPRGVGPMTIACLLRNTLYAAARQHNLSLPE